jgi:hypothetical protein
MAQLRALFTATAGPNRGDSIIVEPGSCRVIGRHLSEHETILIDVAGNRVLEAQTEALIQRTLGERAAVGEPAGFRNDLFERGPDVIFADDSISRTHAIVFYDQQSLGVIDLGSTNGTYVNAERVSSVAVRDGDVITLGNSELTVSVR